MSDILFHQDIVRSEIEEQAKRRVIVELYRPLVKTGIEFSCKWSKTHKRNWEAKHRYSDLNFAIGLGTINCLGLNLHLGKTDSITKDVGPIIEELMEHPHFQEPTSNDNPQYGFVGWEFRARGKFNGHHPSLLVRAWFKESDKCKTVGTGEFEEKMKVVCEE